MLFEIANIVPNSVSGSAECADCAYEAHDDFSFHECYLRLLICNILFEYFLDECTVCLDIVHPRCVEKTIGLGQINHDLSNSWECAKCSNSGYSTVPSRQR